MKNFVQIFILTAIFCSARTANILGLFGCGSRSHYLWNEIIVGALAERGHTLTIASVDVNKSPKPNVTYIHMEKMYDFKRDHIGTVVEFVGVFTPGAFRNARFQYNLKMITCNGIFESNGFQDVLNLNKKFDLILYDTETGPCMLRVLEKYPDVPVVGVTAYKMDPRVVEMLGGHSYPGYISHIFKKHEMPVSLRKRLENTGTYLFAYLYRKFISDRCIEAMAKTYIPGLKASLASLYERIQIVLVNTHPSMDYAQSLPPNIVEVGGLHIKQPKPLPNNINEFLDSAGKGAVLISLGSNLRAELLGKRRIEALINVITRLPEYNFVWKVENKNVSRKFPKNLLIQEWLPQNDILAHPKLKVFFTHAGGLSMQEAAFNGKPVVTIPFCNDQPNNAFLAEENGYGRVVTLDEFSEDTIYSALSEVLSNPNYSRNMLELQKKFLDRPSKPLDTAIWWIEYILRNPKANHLSPYSRNMSYFVANSIDIVLVACCLISLILFVCFWILLKVSKKVLNKFKSKLQIKHLTSNKLKKN